MTENMFYYTEASETHDQPCNHRKKMMYKELVEYDNKKMKAITGKLCADVVCKEKKHLNFLPLKFFRIEETGSFISITVNRAVKSLYVVHWLNIVCTVIKTCIGTQRTVVSGAPGY